VSLTDPQEDTPCRDCKRPTQHDTERCDDCRTPAGRLVTALAALGVKATPIDSFDVVVDKITVSADHLSWCLLCDDDTSDHAHNVEAAADAIAAIVQAPGLRAENEVLTNDLGHYMAEAHQRTEERDTLAARVKELEATVAVFNDPAAYKQVVSDWTAARVAALEAHNARMVALLSKIADAMDAADREPTWSDRMIVVTDSLPDATDLRRLAAGEVDDG